MAAVPDFTQIVKDHQSMVYSLALHSLEDAAAAEDLAQEVFLTLYRNLDSLESPAHVKHWLIRTTVNRCVDESRKRRLRKHPSLEQVPEARARTGWSDVFLQKRLRDCIASLPEQARMMVVLRYQEDLDPSDIADHLDMPVASVKSRLHRALTLLRKKMEARVLVQKVEA